MPTDNAEGLMVCPKAGECTAQSCNHRDVHEYREACITCPCGRGKDGGFDGVICVPYIPPSPCGDHRDCATCINAEDCETPPAPQAFDGATARRVWEAMHLHCQHGTPPDAFGTYWCMEGENAGDACLFDLCPLVR